MNSILRNALTVAALAIAPQVVAQVTFYENEGFAGYSFTAREQIGNFERYGFNDRASSVVVTRERWEVCEEPHFRGRCIVLRPGRYASLAAIGLNDRVSSVRAVNRNARIEDNRYAAVPVPAAAQITFYEREGFAGRSFTANEQIANFERYGFNDRASSAVVVGKRWEVCEGARFGGRCVVLRAGRYPSLAAMSLNDRVSSVRAVNQNARIDDQRYAPAPVAVYDYRRRNNERLYEAEVTSVRAVIGPPEHRCWVEREQVSQDRGNASIPGGIVGAAIGGILGHQIGGGHDRDFATVGGAVVGGVVGANVGRASGGQQPNQQVQRCAEVPSQRQPESWDVSYAFRGQEHRMQMTVPPGPTVTVNELGEPRA